MNDSDELRPTKRNLRLVPDIYGTWSPVEVLWTAFDRAEVRFLVKEAGQAQSTKRVIRRTQELLSRLSEVYDSDDPRLLDGSMSLAQILPTPHQHPIYPVYLSKEITVSARCMYGCRYVGMGVCMCVYMNGCICQTMRITRHRH